MADDTSAWGLFNSDSDDDDDDDDDDDEAANEVPTVAVAMGAIRIEQQQEEREIVPREDVPPELLRKLRQAVAMLAGLKALKEMPQLPEEAARFFDQMEGLLQTIAAMAGWDLHHRTKLPTPDQMTTCVSVAAISALVSDLPDVAHAFGLLSVQAVVGKSGIAGADTGAYATRPIKALHRIAVFYGYPVRGARTSTYAYESCLKHYIDAAEATFDTVLPEFSRSAGPFLNEPSPPHHANCAWFHPTPTPGQSERHVLAECFAARDIKQGEELFWCYGQGYEGARVGYTVDAGEYLSVKLLRQPNTPTTGGDGDQNNDNPPSSGVNTTSGGVSGIAAAGGGGGGGAGGGATALPAPDSVPSGGQMYYVLEGQEQGERVAATAVERAWHESLEAFRAYVSLANASR